MIGVIALSATLITSLFTDAAVRPRRGRLRVWQGCLLHCLVMIAVFGAMLAASGNPMASGLVTIAFASLLPVTSNAKFAVLGEPLLFSDLALVINLVRHPRFYFTALTSIQKVAVGIGAPLLFAAFCVTIRQDPGAQLTGLALLCGATVLIAVAVGRFASLVSPDDVDSDVHRFGLVATMLLHWHRWRVGPDPAPLLINSVPNADRPEVIVVVQCESFADPVALTGDAGQALPGLERARAMAWQYGELRVSGFGAYTMRTEYGVLFGRSEEALGFRRFDPFLTALRERSYALPAKLAPYGYRSFFVHPHDMRFYRRDRLMPAVGFTDLVGQDHFPPPEAGCRYVGDRVLGASLARLVETAEEPTLIYAVTMENHGPWNGAPGSGELCGVAAYLHHLRNSDAMLSELMESLSSSRRSALLVFFGDHRPSLPGISHPGGERHTPYVIVRFAADGSHVAPELSSVDLTPAGLHAALMACIEST